MKWRIAAAGFLLAWTNLQAVILYRTGDPAANTTAPSGPGYDDSGWQYEGEWSAFLGTPIAPHFFLTASHVGSYAALHFQGVDYHVIGTFQAPQSDLILYKIAETFPLFAPIYSRTDEVGQRMILIGRGTRRGDPVSLGGDLKGWSWGAGDNVQRWGENIVSGIYQYGAGNDFLFANFDQAGLPNECHLSSGDSAGAAFIQDGATWKLAGINYAVDGPFYPDATGANGFFAALFDTSGFFGLDEQNHYVPVTGPSALYPTRVSIKLPWICETVAQPQPGQETGFATITFTRITLPASDIVYTVQQSTDLISWSTASAAETIISTSASTQVVKESVTLPAEGTLFLRLSVTRPNE